MLHRERKRMIKSKLIQILTNKVSDLNEETVTRCVNYVIKMLTQALASGERIEIRGFGSLTNREQSPRSARNPRTGAEVVTKPKRKPHFKPGKELRDLVNKSKKKVRDTAEAA